jgi:hypothetical protein
LIEVISEENIAIVRIVAITTATNIILMLNSTVHYGY